MRLKVKISLLVSLTIFSILLASSLVSSFFRIREIQNELLQKDVLISERILPDLLDDFAQLFFFQYDRYIEIVGTHIQPYPELVTFRIFNPEGDIVFDYAQAHSENNTPLEKITDPKILEIIHSSKVYQDYSTYKNESTIRVFIPYIDRFGSFRNVVEFHFSLHKITEAIWQAMLSFIFLLLLFSGAGVIITLLIVHRITKPITSLTRAVDIIGKGNLDTTVPITSKDEIGELAARFNQMTQDLKKSRAQLEEYSHTLEQQVAQRTQELQVKIHDMERLQNIAVNRELKMIELKQRLQEVEAELETTQASRVI